MKYIKTIIIFISALCLLASCRQQTDDVPGREGGDTSYYDQGKTSACWIYAMCVCIEHERELKGDTVPLSRQWIMAKYMEEQTLWLYHINNDAERETNADDADATADGGDNGWGMGFNIRGVGPEVLRLIAKYGLVPYTHERTHIASDRVTIRHLTFQAYHARSLASLRDSMEDILPRFTLSHGIDGAFYYLSMRYTPQQFGESIMYDQHWQFYASVDYHAWGERFALEVPDNKLRHEYTNVTMDEMLQRVMASLKAHHAVYWEYGKKRGSEHAMAIVGMKKGSDGNTLLVCRNSYGRNWGADGCCAVTLDFFRKHTCNVGIVYSE